MILIRFEALFRSTGGRFPPLQVRALGIPRISRNVLIFLLFVTIFNMILLGFYEETGVLGGPRRVLGGS